MTILNGTMLKVLEKKITYSTVIITAIIAIFFLTLIIRDNKEVDKSDYNKIFYGAYNEKEIFTIKKQPMSDINALILAMYYTRNKESDIPQRDFWTEMCSFYVGNLGTCIKSNIINNEMEKEVSKSVMINRAKFMGEKIDINFNDNLTLTENNLIYNYPLTPQDLDTINNSQKKCYYLHVGARNKNPILIKILTKEIENYKMNQSSCYHELIAINSYFKTYIDKYKEIINTPVF